MPQPDFGACLRACTECADACDACAAASLRQEPWMAMAGCIAVAIDCAAMCRVVAGFMARASAHGGAVAEACAKLCEICALECARHDVPQCQACAQTCRDCARHCYDVAALLLTQTANPANP
ncbi:four-helix bundle copper-binding protein [Chitiniphilus purpureus]|uniref:Four-helix bundle copper-binding protein n=1 Tax=Chitiniphilus purpureus TaxID=2981137 RepID=A0ABY6DI11_9NEIS|nr:four-helix bundle copper-binding protein [Chitiniphilus sp. CD1]UXY13667.1 four-helix bundle copper-binding protein [Chitiniphilus sp. CD1]